MPNNSELEKEYEEFSQAIDSKTQEEIKKLRKKLQLVKSEAEKTGEALDASLGREQS